MIARAVTFLECLANCAGSGGSRVSVPPPSASLRYATPLCRREGSLDGCHEVADRVEHDVRMGEHRAVATRHLVGRGAHPLAVSRCRSGGRASSPSAVEPKPMMGGDGIEPPAPCV